MIPGTTSKLSESVLASAATIYPKTDLVRLTGTTSIGTIAPTFGGGFSGFLVLVPTAGAVTLLDSGNIAVTVVMADLRATLLVYSKASGKWHPGAIS